MAPLSPAASSIKPLSTEQFQFEVTVAGGDLDFRIPLSSNLGGTALHACDWNIDWGDESVAEHYTQDGTAANSSGILHSYAAANTYTITITPAGSTSAWLGAFGFYQITNIGEANTEQNRDKVTKLLSPITPSMTRTPTQINATKVADVPSNEWYTTFRNCHNLTMGQDFTFDQAAWAPVTTVSDKFAFYMFAGCNGDAFNMGANFALPQNITTVGDYFAASMFYMCYGSNFNMNSGFNLPQGITTAGDSFAHSMFIQCAGDAFTMNGVFNLPEEIETVGDYFAAFMFASCTGSTFTMNSVFNLPQELSAVGDGFAAGMFAGCTGDGFTINDAFVFPEEAGASAFIFTFADIRPTPQQSRTIASIINGYATPADPSFTFSGSFSLDDPTVTSQAGAFSDWDDHPYNWGCGLSPLADKEDYFQFKVTVTADSLDFNIPISGRVGLGMADVSQDYDWDIDWGDTTVEYWAHIGSSSVASPTGTAPASHPTSAGIPHTYAAPGTYTITIASHTDDTEAWFAAFGFGTTGYWSSPAHAATNKAKVTQVLSPIKPNMTRTNAQIIATDVADVPEDEWQNTFRDCVNLTMGPDFTFDQDAWEPVTVVGDSFANNMFSGCTGNDFTMSDAFNLPQNITTAGDYAFSLMFRSCGGSAFTMGDAFNLPQDIDTAGSWFATFMFAGCIGDAFTMNDVFNLPQNITTVDGEYFASVMFYGCLGSDFEINEVFKFPNNDDIVGASTSYIGTFAYIRDTAVQNRTIASIINGNDTPADQRYTFSKDETVVTSQEDAFIDWYENPINWGCGGYALTTASSNASHGTVTTPAASPSYHGSGATVSLVATPESGYEFTGWTSSDVTFADANSASTTFTMPAGDATVTASFGVASTYTIAVEYRDRSGVEIATATSAAVSPGGDFGTQTTPPLVIETITNKVAIGYTLDGGSLTSPLPSTDILTNIAAAHTVVIVYGDDYVNGSGASISDGIEDVTINKVWETTAGTPVTLTGVDAATTPRHINVGGSFTDAHGGVTETGYRYVGYKIGSGGQQTGTPYLTPLSVLLHNNITVTYLYESVYTLTTASSNNLFGTVTTPAASTGEYAEGEVVSLGVTPASAAYEFTGWTSSTGGTFGNISNASTTFTMPASDTTVTASFALKTYTINVEYKDRNGSTIDTATSEIVGHGGDFGTQTTPDLDDRAIANMMLVGYQINGGTLISPLPDTPILTNITAMYTITLVYGGDYVDGSGDPGSDGTEDVTINKVWETIGGAPLTGIDAATKHINLGGSFTDAHGGISQTGYIYVGYKVGAGSQQAGTPNLDPLELTHDNLTITYLYDTAYALTTASSNNSHGTVTTPATSPTYHVAGEVISITANTAAHYLFDHWTSSAGGTFGSESSSLTTFTMPASDVTITAVFEPYTSYSITTDALMFLTVAEAQAILDAADVPAALFAAGNGKAEKRVGDTVTDTDYYVDSGSILAVPGVYYVEFKVTEDPLREGSMYYVVYGGNVADEGDDDFLSATTPQVFTEAEAAAFADESAADKFYEKASVSGYKEVVKNCLPIDSGDVTVSGDDLFSATPGIYPVTFTSKHDTDIAVTVEFVVVAGNITDNSADYVLAASNPIYMTVAQATAFLSGSADYYAAAGVNGFDLTGPLAAALTSADVSLTGTISAVVDSYPVNFAVKADTSVNVSVNFIVYNADVTIDVEYEDRSGSTIETATSAAVEHGGSFGKQTSPALNVKSIANKTVIGYKVDNGSLTSPMTDSAILTNITAEHTITLVYGDDYVDNSGATGSDGIEDVTINKTWKTLDESTTLTSSGAATRRLNLGQYFIDVHGGVNEPGYSYVGYKIGSGAQTTGIPNHGPLTAADNNLTVTYLYEMVYTVTWMSQDGLTALETDSAVAYGTQPSYDGSAPTKSSDAQYDYTFEGWAASQDQEAGTAEDLLSTVAGNVTYYAAFSKTTRVYTLTTQSNNNAYGTVTTPATSSGTYTSGAIVNLVATPKAGYEFTGWTSTNGGSFASASSASTTFTMPANNTTVTASFGIATTYTITVEYKNRNDVEIATATTAAVTPGGDFGTQTIPALHVETITDKTVIGYKVDNGSLTSPMTDAAILTNITAAHTITLVYGDDYVNISGGSGSDGFEDVTINKAWETTDGSPLTGTEAATKHLNLGQYFIDAHGGVTESGYRYVGYKIGSGPQMTGTPNYGSLTIADNNLTVAYLYEIATTYTISAEAQVFLTVAEAREILGEADIPGAMFDAANGEAKKLVGATTTDTAIVADNNILDNPGAYLVIFEVKADTSVKVEVNFIVYNTVAYNVNGGTGSVPMDATKYTGGVANVKFSPLPTRNGYHFLGWSENKNATAATYTATGATFNITHDVTLYAIWAVNQTPPPVNPPPVNPPPVNPPVNPPTVTSPVDPPTTETPVEPEAPIEEPKEPKASDETPDEKSSEDTAENSGNDVVVNGVTLKGFDFSGEAVAKLEAQTGNIFSDIGKGNVPFGSFLGKGAWGFVNLLLSVIAILITAFLAVGAIRSRRRVGFARAFAIVAGILTLVVWLLLDDLNDTPMVWINQYTIFVGLLFVLQVVSAIIYKVRKGNSPSEAEGMDAPMS